ncbi:hypothetical protein GAMM_350031 [Gammaproteobacteria bacterium]
MILVKKYFECKNLEPIVRGANMRLIFHKTHIIYFNGDR